MLCHRTQCFSLEEGLRDGRVVAVDVDHEGGESGRTVHDVLLDEGLGGVDVGLVGVLTFNEVLIKETTESASLIYKMMQSGR